MAKVKPGLQEAAQALVAAHVRSETIFQEAYDLAKTFLREFPVRNYSDRKSHKLARALLQKLEDIPPGSPDRGDGVGA